MDILTLFENIYSVMRVILGDGSQFIYYPKSPLCEYVSDNFFGAHDKIMM